MKLGLDRGIKSPLRRTLLNLVEKLNNLIEITVRPSLLFLTPHSSLPSLPLEVPHDLSDSSFSLFLALHLLPPASISKSAFAANRTSSRPRFRLSIRIHSIQIPDNLPNRIVPLNSPTRHSPFPHAPPFRTYPTLTVLTSIHTRIPLLPPPLFRSTLRREICSAPSRKGRRVVL